MACASSPDGRGATPGRAPPRRDRASDRGWRDAAPRRAGWPPSWPSGTRPSSSSVGGSGCGDRGGTTLDSEGICAVGAGPSWCGPRRAPPRRKWQALPREPRPETDAGTAKKEEEINGEAGRKPIKKMAPFQAASFGHFSEGRWQSSGNAWRLDVAWRSVRGKRPGIAGARSRCRMRTAGSSSSRQPPGSNDAIASR